MTAPLVLTGEQKEDIISSLNTAREIARREGNFVAVHKFDNALEILTSPRTEALGLSKKTWIEMASWGEDYEEVCGEVYKRSKALRAIASSLSDKGEA